MFKKVIVTGSIAFDEIMNFPSSFGDYIKPDKIHKLNVSFVVDKLEKQIGGTGTNIAYNINLLQKNVAHLASSIGDDGDIFIDWMHTQGLSTDDILIDDAEYTATGKAITDKDDNQIWGFYYGACEAAKKIDIRSKLNSETILVISANHPKAFMNFQKQAIEKEIAYLYDPGMALTWISKDDLTEGILHCRWLIGNDYEIERILEITGLTVDQLVHKNIAVITTLGSKGVSYQDKSETLSIPSFKLQKIVDPTGAGDAWRGGFLAGLINNLEIKDALTQANALASFAVERYGTVNHKPNESEISERMKEIGKLI